MDERELAARCLAGDGRAVADLVGRFQHEVLGLCLRVLCHRQDAEDVTQEVFLRVFRSLNRWDGERPLRPWVMGIAVNRCRTWLSRRSRRPEPVDNLQEVPARDAPDGDAAEVAAEVYAALAEARPEYRAVFAMFHERAMSYEEIAAAVGRPVGTVKTWLHRARGEVLTRLRRRGLVPDGQTPARGG